MYQWGNDEERARRGLNNWLRNKERLLAGRRVPWSMNHIEERIAYWTAELVAIRMGVK